MRAVLEMREGFRRRPTTAVPATPIFICKRARRSKPPGNASWRRIADAEGRIRSRLRDLRHRHRHEFCGRPELRNCAANIATWADRYQPPPDERSPRLGRFPYLADDYALMERVAGETPWIADIHVFAIASTMSFGASGSSINAMTTAVPKLVHGLTRGLFRADCRAALGFVQGI
jgi:hypothetical protein